MFYCCIQIASRNRMTHMEFPACGCGGVDIVILFRNMGWVCGSYLECKRMLREKYPKKVRGQNEVNTLI
jgi:hypothetical protein